MFLSTYFVIDDAIVLCLCKSKFGGNVLQTTGCLSFSFATIAAFLQQPYNRKYNLFPTSIK